MNNKNCKKKSEIKIDIDNYIRFPIFEIKKYDYY